MMRTALVLDADSPAGLEALQSLGRKGLATHAASPDDCLAFRSRRVSRRWKQPISEPTAFLRWLRDLDAEHAYALIVPSTERSLRMLLSLPDDDALVAKAVLAPRASLETALDKWATAELALSCGVPALPTRLLASLSDLAGARSFPVVLKTLRSVVDIDGELTHVPARLARDAEERQRFCELFLPHTPVIEQTYERGHGVGIELLYDRGRRIWHFCHERLHEGTGQEGLGSGSLYRRSAVAPPDLLHYATAMLDRLSWHGVAMVEFLVAPTGESWLMEINPRLWGSVALPIDAGVDFPAGLLLLKEKLGRLSPAAVAVACWATAAAAWAYAVSRPRGGARPGRPAMIIAAASGVLDTFANLAVLLAVRHGSLAVVAVIVALYPGSTVLLARLTLGERLSRSQAAGLGGAAAAVVLLALAS